MRFAFGGCCAAALGHNKFQTEIIQQETQWKKRILFFK